MRLTSTWGAPPAEERAASATDRETTAARACGLQTRSGKLSGGGLVGLSRADAAVIDRRDVTADGTAGGCREVRPTTVVRRRAADDLHGTTRVHMMTAGLSTVTFATVSLEAVRRLLEPPPPPCLSVYLPTHRTVPDNRVDQPSFARLVAALEMSLSAGHRRDEIERLLRPFRQLADDRRFWEHTRDGLAVLAAGGTATVFLLPRPVRPLAVVTDRFLLLPLLRAAAAVERFNLLALTAREARIYEVTAAAGAAGRPHVRVTVDRLDPVPLPAAAGRGAAEGVLAASDVTDEVVLEPHRVKLGMGPAGLGTGGVVHGGFGSKQDETDKDTAIFLRYVDDVIHREVSRASGLPLVLVAGGRLAAAFRDLSDNPRLAAETIATDPHLHSPAVLAEAAAVAVAGDREARIARAVAAFGKARDHGLGSGDPADIARAAVAGRVATLFVEADRFEPGAFDETTGAIEPATGLDAVAAGPPDPSRAGGGALETGDLCGRVAETVLATGGTIVPLVRNAMPTETGLAAVYRY